MSSKDERSRGARSTRPLSSKEAARMVRKEAAYMLDDRDDLARRFEDALLVHLPALTESGLLPLTHYNDIVERLQDNCRHAKSIEFRRVLMILEETADIYTVLNPVDVLVPRPRLTWAARAVQFAEGIVVRPSQCKFIECMDPLCPHLHEHDRASIVNLALSVITVVCLAPMEHRGILAPAMVASIRRRLQDAMISTASAREALERATEFVSSNDSFKALDVRAVADADVEALQRADGWRNRCALLCLARLLPSTQRCKALPCPNAFCAHSHAPADIGEDVAFLHLLGLLREEANARGVWPKGMPLHFEEKLLSQTPPSSRHSRISETAVLLTMSGIKAFASLGVHGLRTCGTYGLPADDDMLAFDADAIEFDGQTRDAIVNSIDKDKLTKQMEHTAKGETEWKHFEHMGIGKATKEALLNFWHELEGTKGKEDEITETSLSLYHLISLFKLAEPAEIVQVLRSAHASYGWDRAKLTSVILIPTLKYLHHNNALQPLLPPSKFEYERECFAAMRRLAHAFQPMVRTRAAEAEGGVRSCLRALHAWAVERGADVALVLRYLVVTSNMLAHQGIVQFPLFLVAVVHAAEFFKGLSPLPVIHSKAQVDPMPSIEADAICVLLTRLAAHVRRLLEWDFAGQHPIRAALPTFSQTVAPDMEDLTAGLASIALKPQAGKGDT